MRQAAAKYANDEFCNSRFAKSPFRLAFVGPDVRRAGRRGCIPDADGSVRSRHTAAGRALPLLGGAARDWTGGQSRDPRVARSPAIATDAAGAGWAIADGASGAAGNDRGMARNRARVVPSAAHRAFAATLSSGSCG